MSRLLLGVMGHVDHGKTALVRALTGMETDRLPEEQRRGISIVLGFAHLRLDGLDVDLIDMPGHERFVRTMVSGATGARAALLVVAANEGIKPQTVEHLQVAALLGLQQVLPVISKIDLVAAEAASARAAEVAELLAETGLRATEPLQVSAEHGVGLEPLRAAVSALARQGAPPQDDGFPYLPVDRVFSLSGHGTVVTGTLRRGALSSDTALAVAPSGLAVRVRGLQVHGQAVERAEPGQRVAVNLRGVEPSEIRPGAALTRPTFLTPSYWLDVALETPRAGPPLKNGVRLNLLFGTAEAPARLRLLDRDVLAPGERAVAQLHSAQPVAVPARERFILRIASPAATVGGGTILDPASQRRRRNDPAALAEVERLAVADPMRIVAGTLSQAGAAGVAAARLAQLAGLAPERVHAELDSLGALKLSGDLLLSPRAFGEARARVLATVAEQVESQPNGVPRRRLHALAAGLPVEVVDAAVQALAAEGKLRLDAGSVRLPPGAGEEAIRARQEALLDAKVARAFAAGGLTPPDPATVSATVQGRRALDRLVREGVIVKTFDRVQKREILFHRDAVAAAKATLVPLLAAPGVLVKDAGAALGVSRKYSVPLLEYLDGVRFTRRVGDRRVLGPNAEA